VGTDYEAITRSANYNVVIGSTEQEVAGRLAALQARLQQHVGAEAAERQVRTLSASPLVGTPEQLAERLTRLQGLGMTYAVGYFPEVAYDRSGLSLFTEKVIPALA